MITVTPTAIEAFTAHFEGKETQPIRIHLADGGCSGPKLSLAIDELRDGDKSVTQDDHTFLIQEELAEAVGKVTIDMGPYGFSVDSEHQIAGGGCGCSSSGSCGSAGSGGGCGSGCS